MVKTQKKRSEIEEQYKWDLTLIYKTDEAWNEDYEILKKEIEEVLNFKDKITKSADDLLSYLKFYYHLELKLNRLYCYAHFQFDSDTTNSYYREMYEKVVNLLNHYNELSAFIHPEMMNTSYETIQNYIKEKKELQEYAFVLEDLYRYKDHILSEKEEQILSSFSNVLSNPSKTFDSLTDSDMRFGTILDENQEEVELTESNYNTFLHHKNREIRKQAFQTMLNTYGSFQNTIAQTYTGNVESLTTLAKLKHFSSSLEHSLFDENVDRKVYDTLIDTVSNHLDVLYDFFALKKEELGLDEFHLYDQYVDLVEASNQMYTYEQAQELVSKALSILGEDYVQNLNRAFKERWIDVYNNVGKRSGAYSDFSGLYDMNPYILLNFEGTFNDVSTLAHELGHSMHSYYASQNNPIQNRNYKIFVAEVASTVNELLLNFYVLNHTEDISLKRFILSNLMSLFKATLYRQTMFAEFERDTHAYKEQGGILTSEYLSNYYYQLNQKYFGPDVIVDDEIRYEWERIPHFYYDFYVYKYAIGLSCACYFVKTILNQEKDALTNYLKFLSMGGSDYPTKELEKSGCDVTNPIVIESAIDMFQDIINQYKQLK